MASSSTRSLDNRPWPPARGSNELVMYESLVLRRVRAVCRNSSIWTFCFYFSNGIKHWIEWVESVSPYQTRLKWLFTFWRCCEFMFIGRRKVGGHFIWFDVNFLWYFPTLKIGRSNLSIPFFACLGKLSLKFHLTVARTLRNIDRKFGDISKRTKREIRRKSFSLLLHSTVVGFSRDNLLEIYSKIAASVNLWRRDSSWEKRDETGNLLLSGTVYLETVDRKETPWICNSHLFLSSYLFFFLKNVLFYNTNPLPEKNSATFSTVADQGNPRARTTYSLVSSFMLSGLACKSKHINLTNDVLVTWSISQEFCLT